MVATRYFLYIADFVHCWAVLFLISKMIQKRTCVGISGRTQLLYVLVFVTRYLDLYTYHSTVYVTTGKILFTLLALMTVYLIYVQFSESYEAGFDTFRIEFLIIPCFILAVFVNQELILLEVLWTFSIYLEVVAMVPQFVMISKKRVADLFVTDYLIIMGCYRAIYVLHWVYKYQVTGEYNIYSAVAGVLQTLFYLIFLIIYCFILQKTSAALIDKKVNVKNSFIGLKSNDALPQKSLGDDQLLLKKNYDDAAKLSDELFERLYTAGTHSNIPKVKSSTFQTV